MVDSEVLIIPRFSESGFVKAGQNDRGNAFPWIAVPTKHDGKGFLRLAAKDPDGSVYGIWILLAAIGGKCAMRGVLADEDGPLSTVDLAMKMHRNVDAVEKAISVLLSPEIKWVSKAAWPLASDVLAICEQHASLTERNGTDGTHKFRPDSGTEPPMALVATATGPVRGPKKAESVFENFFTHPERLRDEARVRRWIDWQKDKPNAVIRHPSAADIDRVLATAREAIAEGKDPVKFFVSYIGRGKEPKRKYYE